MCLRYASEVAPENEAGYGYKIVKIVSNTEFLPQYPHFLNNGRGGCRFRSPNTTKVNLKYRLLETAFPEKQRMALTHDTKTVYFAGIHLYVKLPLDPLAYGCAVIRCHYRKATFTDGETIVAEEVTPIRVIRYPIGG